MERRRLHEAQHAQVENPVDEEQGALTAGDKTDEDEEEKEIDPSIVGSLDDVYKDDPNGEMKEEDPFKKVPVMGDHDKPTKEMEKSFDAMAALVVESPGSPLPEDATSLDKELRHPPSDSALADAQALPDLVGAAGQQDPTPVLSPSQPSPPSSSSSVSGLVTTPASTSSSGLPLDLAVGARKAVDLLDDATGGLPNSRPVDLTQGLQPAATFSS